MPALVESQTSLERNKNDHKKISKRTLAAAVLFLYAHTHHRVGDWSESTVQLYVTDDVSNNA